MSFYEQAWNHFSPKISFFSTKKDGKQTQPPCFSTLHSHRHPQASCFILSMMIMPQTLCPRRTDQLGHAFGLFIMIDVIIHTVALRRNTDGFNVRYLKNEIRIICHVEMTFPTRSPNRSDKITFYTPSSFVNCNTSAVHARSRWILSVCNTVLTPCCFFGT